MRAASRAGVGTSNSSQMPASTPSVDRIRFTSRVTSRECPPSSKKSSSGPTCSTPRTEAKISHRTRSCSVAGSRASAPARYSGAGRAARSTFPLAVRGSSVSSTTAAGTMWSGRCSPVWARSSRARSVPLLWSPRLACPPSAPRPPC